MNPSDQIEARLALEALANRDGKRRNRAQARRYLLRCAVCAFGEARRELSFKATFAATTSLPAGVELGRDWELWVLPFQLAGRAAPLVARLVTLPLFASLVRDTTGLKRGPDFAMQALDWALRDDAELARAIQAIEATTELVQDALAASEKKRATGK